MRDYIEKQPLKRLTECTALALFSQICQGYSELYKRKVMHRDIKLENVFMYYHSAMIGDLGQAKAEQTQMRTMAGTRWYWALELWYGQSYTYKADVWALGVTLYYM